ncbi:MAG: hypothetical protein ACM33T_06515 [Solirubrobacterales bacterium]
MPKRELLPVHLPREVIHRVLAVRGLHTVNDRELVEVAEDALPVVLLEWLELVREKP